MGFRGLLIAVCACTFGCAETQLETTAQTDPMLPLIQQHVALTPPGDTFWLAASREEVTRPPLVRARSISLGYIGDTPLTGGVMRDTPMPTPLPMIENDIQPAPRCACRNPRYEFEEPYR